MMDLINNEHHRKKKIQKPVERIVDFCRETAQAKKFFLIILKKNMKQKKAVTNKQNW